MSITMSMMKLEEKAQEKKEELQNIVKSYFSQFKINNLDEFSQMIIEKFIIITPPEGIVIPSQKRCDNDEMHLITMNPYSKEAISFKLFSG